MRDMSADELRLLLIEADSYLSWALHRYNEKWPQDFTREVNDLIGKIRKETG